MKVDVHGVPLTGRRRFADETAGMIGRVSRLT